MKRDKGSIAIFVLVALLFMSAFLIISFASNINKSKTVKEQFNIISGIYAYANGEEGAYEKAYSDLRNKNKQTMTAFIENSSTLELTNTFNENMSNYRIYGNSVQNGTPTPEAPIEVQSVGDLVTDTTDANYGKREIPVKISGENLFNKDLSQIEYVDYVTSDGDSVSGVIWSDMSKYIGQETSWYTTGPVEIKPNTTYVYSGFQSANNPGYCFLNKDKSTIYNGAPIKGNGTFVTPQDAAYIIFSVYKDNISTAQITEETEEIKVNIYLNEPLRKVGDYADYIDFKTGKVVRYVGKIDSYNGETITTSWISSTGELSNGATVYYVLETPTEETVTLPQLKSYEDYTKIEVLTSVAPSKIEAEYVGYTLE